MRPAAAVLAILLLTAACQQGDDVRTRLAETERLLRNARTEAADNAKVANERRIALEKEKARAVAAEQKLERLKVLYVDLDAACNPPAMRSTYAPAAAIPSRPAPLPPAGRGSAWQDLERQQAAKRAAWQRRLESTTVYAAGSDGTYHGYDCAGLYRTETDRYGYTSRKYIGSSITLAAAHDRRLTRDAACGPPSYEFRYSD